MDVDVRNVINITQHGLTYLTEDGTEAFIDFALCYDAYRKKLMEPSNLEAFKQLNHMTDEGLANWLKTHESWKEVAQRSIIGDWPDGSKQPYIEFHTDPPTRFLFATEDEFRQTRHKIEQFGWRTRDLS